MALLDDTVNRILADEAGDAWTALHEAGLTAVGIPERSGAPAATSPTRPPSCGRPATTRRTFRWRRPGSPVAC